MSNSAPASSSLAAREASDGLIRTLALFFRFAVLATVPAACFAGAYADELQLDGNICYRLDFRERDETLLDNLIPASLGWTTSAVWNGQKLILADHTYKNLVRASLHGEVERTSTKLDSTKKDTSYKVTEPWYVYPRSPQGYIFADKSNNLIHFMNENDVSEHPPISTRADNLRNGIEDEVEVRGVYRAVPVEAGTSPTGARANGIVALTETRHKIGESRRTEFMYIDRSDKGYYPFDVGAELYATELSDEGLASDDAGKLLVRMRRAYYKNDFNYNAVIDNSVYSLIVTRIPWIARLDVEDLSVTRLNLPPGLGLRFIRPDMPNPTSRDEVIQNKFDQYRKIEGQRMPLGLLSWQGRLMLIIKGAEAPRLNAAEFQVVEVSTSDGTLLGPLITLPVALAAHIHLVAIENHVVAIEKSGIRKIPLESSFMLDRPVSSASLIPSRIMTGEAFSGECQKILLDD